MVTKEVTPPHGIDVQCHLLYIIQIFSGTIGTCLVWPDYTL